jgi:hypothetical protein
MKMIPFEKEELTLPNGKKIIFFSYKVNLPLKLFKEETPSVLQKEFFEKNWISVLTGISNINEPENSNKFEENKPEEKVDDDVEKEPVSLKDKIGKIKSELKKTKSQLKELTRDVDLSYREIPLGEAELLNKILSELYKDEEKFSEVIKIIENNLKEKGATGTISILRKYNIFSKILFKWEEKRKSQYSEYFKFVKTPGFPTNLSFIDPREYKKLPEMFKGTILISEIEHPVYIKNIEDLYYASEKNVDAILAILKDHVEPKILDIQTVRVVKTKKVFNELTVDYKTYLNVFENFARNAKNELIKDFVYRVLLFPAVLTEITESFVPIEKSSVYYILNTFYLSLYDAIYLKGKSYQEISQYFLSREERFNVYKDVLKTKGHLFSDFYEFTKLIKNKYQQQVNLLEFCVFWNKHISISSIVTPVTIAGELGTLDI